MEWAWCHARPRQQVGWIVGLGAGAAKKVACSKLAAFQRQMQHPDNSCDCTPPPRRPHSPLSLQVGRRNRSVGATLMNQDSSRSHSVFTITVEAAAIDRAPDGGSGGSDSGSTGGAGGGGSGIRVGKLNLVDLAGRRVGGVVGAV